MDMHVCVHTIANDGDAESGPDKSGAVHLRPNGERWKYRNLDDKFDKWLERINLHGPVTQQFPEPDSHH